MAGVYVYEVPVEQLPEGVDGLEVLVQVYDTGPPEVALRETFDSIALRVWGPPLPVKSSAVDT